MAVMKCKMCGGDLEITGGSNIAVCEYCGTKQTVPTLDNERKTSLFGRAGRLLRACEFDKASVVFGDIVSEFPEEAEGYWGLLLCKYGVEYVDDPATGKKIPTCHRLSFNSVMEDSDFEQACENADSAARSVYREEAKFLEELRRRVIEVSSKEEPYDVFICYKETDANGDRTIDSVMAQDIYDELTEKGLKVFFARITLEDKLGQEYEPYIFAALNSAKVMLAIGTDYEYFNAVWVKNEWSRFLKLIAKGEKKVLIPCYKDIDAYDMPKEFKNLQAQDMGKLGFMQDLVRGVCKIIGEKKTVVQATSVSGNPNTEQLLKRANMALEDGDFVKADVFCEQVLNIDAENAEAYLGKLMVELKVKRRDELCNCAEPFDDKNNYHKAIRFGNAKLREGLEKDNEKIRERNHLKQLENFYKNACRSMDFAKTEEDYKKAADVFKNIIEFKDSNVKKRICLEKAEEARKEAIYYKACSVKKQKSIMNYETAILYFEQISDFKDSAEQIMFCKDEIKRIKILLEKAEIEKEKRKKKNKKIATIAISTVAFVMAAVVVFTTVIQPMMNYNAAVSLMEEGKYEEAITAFEAMDYKDSKEKVLESQYLYAIALIEDGKFEEAIAAFEAMEGYKDSEEQIENCKTIILDREYEVAVGYIAKKDYKKAIEAFERLSGYKDSEKQIENCKTAISEEKYAKAVSLIEEEKYKEAIEVLSDIKDYKDSFEKIESARKLSIKNCKAGDIITFGFYEQDGNTENGEESVEWIVLEVKNSKAFVISEKILNFKQYEISREYSKQFTWENCSLRNWLNHGFLVNAFSDDEQKIIVSSNIPADKNPTYPTNPGKATKDKIFLLSVKEVDEYSELLSKKPANPTRVVKEAAPSSGPDAYCWWLRTPGDSGSYSAYVGKTGMVFDGGRTQSCYYGVRPAMWIDLSAIE